MELVLVLGIVAMLAGVVLVNVPAFRSSRILDEGGRRFATGLRMARADAANRGRRIRLAFDPDTYDPLVLWEPEPLTAPGEFVLFTACGWQRFLKVEGVWVERCDFTGDSMYRALVDAGVAGELAQESDLATITFEPNGSSDSVVVLLVAAEAPDGPRARIALNGVTGIVDWNVLTLEELDVLEMAMEAP
ncbi:MAG: GspH/FimT family pseudopilin [Planctomycetes bacterium]|nr:GspH/FimT family pseudopilin [Planctomycetota bacterium]